MSIITRLFDSPSQAQAAIDELHQNEIGDDVIHVVQPPSRAASRADDDPAASAAHPASSPETDPIAEQLMAAGVASSAARAYADGVRQGRTALVVNAPFGYAAAALEILERHNATDLGFADEYPQRQDPAAPLSARFGWRVLLDDPAPLSRRFGWRVLSERQNPNIKLDPEPAPLSKKFGWSLLSGNPTPLSNRFGWSLLSHNPTPLSSKIGLAVLSRRQQPKVELSHNPAPLSSFLRWRLLSDNPTPLSSKLGWRVLKRD